MSAKSKTGGQVQVPQVMPEQVRGRAIEFALQSYAAIPMQNSNDSVVGRAGAIFDFIMSNKR